jgi:hypothetical protein
LRSYLKENPKYYKNNHQLIFIVLNGMSNLQHCCEEHEKTQKSRYHLRNIVSGKGKKEQKGDSKRIY